MKKGCCGIKPVTDNRSLYEGTAFNGLTGGIRPGGLPLTEYLIELCGFSEGDMVVDIGCGYGLTADHLRKKYGFETAGIDLSAFLLKKGIERVADLRLINGRGEMLPFHDSSFNGAIAECNLSVMDDPGRVLKEVNRILKPGGRLAVSDVNIRRPEYAGALRRLPLRGCLSGAFVTKEFFSMLNDAGFSIVSMEDHSVLWKIFSAGLILNSESLSDIISCGQDSSCGLNVLMPEILKAKPGYFSVVAEKNF